MLWAIYNISNFRTVPICMKLKPQNGRKLTEAAGEFGDGRELVLARRALEAHSSGSSGKEL